MKKSGFSARSRSGPLAHPGPLGQRPGPPVRYRVQRVCGTGGRAGTEPGSIARGYRAGRGQCAVPTSLVCGGDRAEVQTVCGQVHCTCLYYRALSGVRYVSPWSGQWARSHGPAGSRHSRPAACSSLPTWRALVRDQAGDRWPGHRWARWCPDSPCAPRAGS